MTAPDSRARRPRTPDTVVDLCPVATDRRPSPGAAVPPPTDVDLAGVDRAFLDAVTGLGGETLLAGLGRHAGSLQQRRLVEDAESSPPRLQTYDASGAPAVVDRRPWWSTGPSATPEGTAGRVGRVGRVGRGQYGSRSVVRPGDGPDDESRGCGNDGCVAG